MAQVLKIKAENDGEESINLKRERSTSADGSDDLAAVHVSRRTLIRPATGSSENPVKKAKQHHQIEIIDLTGD